MRVFLQVEIYLPDEEYSSLPEEELEEQVLQDAVDEYLAGRFKLACNPINGQIDDFEYYFDNEKN